MTTIHLHLPDELRERLVQRASDAGHSSVEQYVESLIRVDVDAIDYGAPESVTFRDDQELERLLTEGLRSGPGREITDADWERKRQELIRRHGRSKG